MITQDEAMRMIMMLNPELYQMMQLMGATTAGTVSAEEAIRRERAMTKKKPTAYQRRYKAAFKKISNKYKLKSGKWKKNGFRLAVKEAHRIAKKGGKK